MNTTRSMDKTTAIGIDLGTTFSAVAAYRNKGCEIVPNKEGHRLTPSLVYYHPDSLEVSVGTSADDLGPQRIDNFIFDIKRIIGRKFDDIYVQSLINSQEYRYKIVRGRDDRVEIQLYHNGRTVYKTPEEISSEILKYLKESASEYLGIEVHEAVVSVPAYFSNAQRKATRTAAELAGLKVLKLITEPVAAAIHYSEERLNDGQSKLLVFDFGGGTLDVSIIEVDEKCFAVKSVEGDTFLGGRDFDQMLLKHFRDSIVDSFGQNAFDDRLLRRVKEKCIRLKTKLSTSQKYSIPIYCIGGNDSANFTLAMTREEFEQISSDLFTRAVYLLQKCLEEAGIEKQQITDVVLVGGTTRIPKVRQLLAKYFSDKEIRTDLNPDEAVALGAGIQAAFLKNKFQELEKYKITEVTPLSLGMSVNTDLMKVAIKKNSPIPTRSEPIITCTADNNQTSGDFEVYEGERKNCKYNNFLGQISVNGLPSGKAGDVKFTTVFSLNEDGILEVEAQENSTGNCKKLVVTIGEYRLCDYKIKRAIDDAESCKKDDEIFERFNKYRHKVGRICQWVLYDLNKIPLKENRDFVKSKCDQFLHILKTTDYKEIDKLESASIAFKTSVIGIVQNVMDVDFSGVELKRDSSLLSKFVANLTIL